jgi:hypothetical protein
MTIIIKIIIIHTVVLMGKSNRKVTLGRPTCGWENAVKMDLQEIGWGVEWMDLAQDRATCELGGESLGSIICREYFDYLINQQPLKDSVQ